MPEDNEPESIPTEVEGATPLCGNHTCPDPQGTRGTWRKFPTEDKIRIVLEGIRGEVGVAELCRREVIHPRIYYK